MRFIVVGCGRMGAGLLVELEHRGHTVTVIDKDATAFDRLGTGFDRRRAVTGHAFDRDALSRAGIERADGLAAMTASDEANIVTARLARHVYRVPRVVARVYDPRMAEIYRRLGVQTVSTTAWGIRRTSELLCYSELDALVSLGEGVEIAEAALPPLLVGRTARELTIAGQAHVVAVRRDGHAFLAVPDTVFEPGDHVVLAVTAAALDRVHAMFGQR